mmetsp:Transcript_76974/g.193607  ORF Transcript_76974/g.193607 Transcript_76974/m.193607 type:complete len:265 (-) Transcript_76974:3886-4680(-)
MAMSFTQRWYSCSMSSKVSLVKPNAKRSMPRSNWHDFKPESGIASMKERNLCAETAWPSCASSLKSSSGFMALLTTCFRNASFKAISASLVTCLRAEANAKTCFLHLESREPTFTFTFTSVVRASLKGPFVAFFIPSRCSLIFANALLIDSSTPSKSFSALSISSRGLSLSAPLELTKACATSTAFSTFSSASPTKLFTSSRILSAPARSKASCRRFFSFSIASCCFFRDSAILDLSDLRSCWTLRIRGPIPSKAVLVSAKGPL